jgi:hypothetical protein
MGQQVLGFELDEVQSLLGKAGLTVTRTLTLTPEPDVKGPALFLVSGRLSY